MKFDLNQEYSHDVIQAACPRLVKVKERGGSSAIVALFYDPDSQVYFEGGYSGSYAYAYTPLAIQAAADWDTSRHFIGKRDRRGIPFNLGEIYSFSEVLLNFPDLKVCAKSADGAFMLHQDPDSGVFFQSGDFTRIHAPTLIRLDLRSESEWDPKGYLKPGEAISFKAGETYPFTEVVSQFPALARVKDSRDQKISLFADAASGVLFELGSFSDGGERFRCLGVMAVADWVK